MPRIFPFEALVYDPAVVGPLAGVTAPPYDVISEPVRRDYEANPYNIVRLDLVDERSTDGYARAGDLLRGWVTAGALRRRPPAFHIYEMRYEYSGREETVRGVICAVELEDWGGSILPHERTMPGPVEDRLRLLRSTQTHLSPIYAIVAGPSPDLADLLTQTTSHPPEAQAIDEQGVVHRRWPVAADVPIASWLAAEDLLIADGHHRYTTALTYRDEMRASSGHGPWDRILAFVVDAGSEHLEVRPFHRIQRSGEMPAEGIPMKDLEAVLAAIDDDEPAIGFVLGTPDGPVFRILPLSGEPPSVRALHASVLDHNVPPDGLLFTPDALEAVAAVREGTAVGAYILPATTPDRIRKIVERGERLPQKSTYFWPKPRTGMALMPLDTPDAG